MQMRKKGHSMTEAGAEEFSGPGGEVARAEVVM